MGQISADRHTKEDGPKEEFYLLQDNLDDEVIFLFLREWVIDMGY